MNANVFLLRLGFNPSQFTYNKALLFVKRISDNLRSICMRLVILITNNDSKLLLIFPYTQNKIKYVNAMIGNINNQFKPITKEIYG